VRFHTLQAWLDWQETLHPAAIELGLERPGKVLQTLGLGSPQHTVITVAGTNGKGSSVAMLESILRAAGYRVGCYTSPHMLQYNERIRIDGEPVDDARLCEAFDRIDRTRGDISLTYFEFGTLAAFEIFDRAALDVVVLEVGMGGRLDAVNLLDADVALVTAIDVDHAAWLGDDREAIGYEKAGIFRSGLPAVCSDPQPPQSLLQQAGELGAQLYCLGQEYRYQSEGDSWNWQGPSMRRDALPLPNLRGAFQLQNAAGVLMVLALLAEKLQVAPQHLRQGLLAVSLPGRFQVWPGEITTILDVAHNPQSAAALAANLAAMPVAGATHAVVAMLADKDVVSVLQYMAGVVDHWYLAGLDVFRGADGATLATALSELGIAAGAPHASVTEALSAARQASRPGDRIVVFGSFYTVAQAMAQAV
jgi:dihydrofolate synthase/folylpolyglutamate synthase